MPPSPLRRSGPHRWLASAFTALTLVVSGAAASQASPAPPAAPKADGPAEAHGLKGEYYTQSASGAFDFAALKATAFDPSLDFADLEPRLKARAGQQDDVSVRWTGRLTPAKTGAHTFSITGDNGFRLWIDGKEVIDHWVDDWDREQNSAPVTLEAGHAYDIKVEYFEHYGGSNLHVRWTPPGGAEEAIPQSAFSLPDGFTYNGPQDSAIQPDGKTLVLDFAQQLKSPRPGSTTTSTSMSAAPPGRAAPPTWTRPTRASWSSP